MADSTTLVSPLMPPRSQYSFDTYNLPPPHDYRKSTMERSAVHFPKLANTTKNAPKSPKNSTSFKKTYSAANNKFHTPLAGATHGGKVTHGLAGEIFRSRGRATDGGAEEPNINSVANPFKFKHNMQEMLIQREKERYAKLAKREFNIK
jgi:hypothetical protein